MEDVRDDLMAKNAEMAAITVKLARKALDMHEFWTTARQWNSFGDLVKAVGRWLKDIEELTRYTPGIKTELDNLIKRKL